MARERTAHVRMSRAARVARGAAGACASTLLAAASHALAGGQVTLLALAATSILALPVCVALAGRVASLWRVSLAVAVSQFIYHWSFAGLGVASGSALSASQALNGAATGSALHAGHLVPPSIPVLAPFLDQAAAAGAADAWMWAAHGLAAALTVTLLHWGERAWVGLLRVLRRALPRSLPRANEPFPRPVIRTILARAHDLRARLISLSAISHRGPPAFVAPIPSPS